MKVASYTIDYVFLLREVATLCSRAARALLSSLLVVVFMIGAGRLASTAKEFDDL